MDTIKFFLENIGKFDKQNIGYINGDFDDEDGDTVKEYVTFHVEELGDEFLEQIDIASDQTDKEQQFLKNKFLHSYLQLFFYFELFLPFHFHGKHQLHKMLEYHLALKKDLMLQ